MHGNDRVERVRKEELQRVRSFHVILGGKLKASCPQSNASGVQATGLHAGGVRGGSRTVSCEVLQGPWSDLV